jgi:hypothetical protein
VRVLIAASVLLASMTVHAADEPDRDAVCMSWARNASIGGGHAMMGHARRLIPMSEENIQELIEHGKLLTVDGIPALKNDSDTPESRAFLEDSIFFGFDYMKKLPEGSTPVSQQQMVSVFLNICRSGDRTVMR